MSIRNSPQSYLILISLVLILCGCQLPPQNEPLSTVNFSDFPKQIDLTGEFVGPSYQFSIPGDIINAGENYIVEDEKKDTIIHILNSNDRYNTMHSFLVRGSTEMNELNSVVNLIPEKSNQQQVSCWVVSTNEVLTYKFLANNSFILDSTSQLTLPFEVNEFKEVLFPKENHFIGINNAHQAEKIKLSDIHTNTLKSIPYSEAETEVFEKLERQRLYVQGSSSFNNERNQFVYSSLLFGYVELYDAQANLLKAIQLSESIEKYSNQILGTPKDPRMIFNDVLFLEDKVLVLYFGMQQSAISPSSTSKILVFDANLQPLEIWNLDHLVLKIAYNEDRHEIIGTYVFNDQQNLIRYKTD